MKRIETIALTGATGFVGGVLLDRLVADGYRVRALTRRAQPARRAVTWIDGALDDAAALRSLMTGSDAVIHVAGVVNAPDRAGFEAGNITGTMALVDAARLCGVRRLIHVSSLAAREPDLSLYGWSKARGEALVRASGLDWTVVRPPAVYGPGDTEMLELFRMAKRGVVLLPPEGRLSVVHVDDLARLLAHLPDQDESWGEIYEPDDGEAGGWTHKSLGKAIGWAVGRRVSTVAAPRALLRVAARMDRAVRGHRAKLTPDRVGYFCHPDWVATARLRPPPALWQPEIGTRSGLKATAAWYREHAML